MNNPWNGKVVLEVFWKNCWNGNYPFDWYTYLAKLAPRLAAMGFDGIWTPPPCKDTNAESNMGYTPYDYYDLGQKNQNGANEEVVHEGRVAQRADCGLGAVRGMVPERGGIR